MKHLQNLLVLSMTALFFTISGFAQAQNTDTDGIHNAIEKYIVGWRTGDVNLLKEAFDMDAGVVLWIDKKEEPEKLRSMTLSDLANKVKPHDGYGTDFEIQQLDIVDSQLAMAKVKIPLPKKDSYYMDYLQLQKINDTWKIVLKSFVYFPKK